MGDCIKQEPGVLPETERAHDLLTLNSSSDLSGFSSDTSDVEFSPSCRKKQRTESVLPIGFLDPIEQPPDVAPIKALTMAIVPVKPEIAVPEEPDAEPVLPIGFLNPIEKALVVSPISTVAGTGKLRGSMQFWKAGDYEGSCISGHNGGEASFVDMDHVRVHPRFLHSNATSHKWALGAFAELLDNALDEGCNGATYVIVDVMENPKDNNKMVVVQDDGGGMAPDKMRGCMSLGYSEKSKMANTIGQYGNGFKTSTMRLGADVIVFSRCRGKCGGSATQSIGLLSYTFLRSTGKEDIVVPMIDYEKVGETWCKLAKSTSDCLQRNLETIMQWSPFETEEDLHKQFDYLSDQGTRIIIYNLWEDEQGLLELDFDTDPHDIQIRGANRDEKKIEMAKVYPSSRHFLTYRHSLRNYTSILYLRIPPDFRIILRGIDVQHHNMVDDMMHTTKLVYKPIGCPDSKDPNMSATVTLGFIKDAAHHIDVQGFNVYHKNRLIKPFWRVWNAAGSDGRGVIGILQADFVEPAHDKQGFERTTSLSRLENRLVHFQKSYWSSKCQLIGYAQRRNLKKHSSPPHANEKSNSKDHDKNPNKPSNVSASTNTYEPANDVAGRTTFSGDPTNEKEHRLPANEGARRNMFVSHATTMNNSRLENSFDLAAPIKTEKIDVSTCANSMTDMAVKTKAENITLRCSLNQALKALQCEKEKNASLENQLQETREMMNKLDQEQEENLRLRLKDASETIRRLLRKVEVLEASTGLRLP